jgi:hypothetical protein
MKGFTCASKSNWELSFYLWYLISYGINRLKGMPHNKAYHQIIFEREAYQEDENLQYLTKRKWLAFLRY